jgi:hypothetical protein
MLNQTEMILACRKVKEKWPNMLTQISTLSGSHGITYHKDENGVYAVIGLNFPPSIFADLGNNDYGELMAIRIYLNGPYEFHG